jgi:rhamnogalacturonyl hydrolase YesR
MTVHSRDTAKSGCILVFLSSRGASSGARLIRADTGIYPLMRTRICFLPLALLASACSPAAQPKSSPPAVEDAGPVLAQPADIEVMTRVAQYELQQLGTAPDDDWVASVFYVGLLASYGVTHDATALSAVKAWGDQHAWALHASRKGPRFADDQCCTQAYLDLDLLDGSPSQETLTQAAQTAFDAMIAAPAPGRQDWYWADALFMAPGALVRLGAVTNDGKYVDFLHAMWWDAQANLFSASTGLYWRDQTFFGQNVYWSRGNGWVAAGTVRVLQYLPPSDVRRGDYEALLAALAAKVVPLQAADGLWRADLLNPAAFPNPETSGSALFTYALAWAVRNGTLQRATYLPVVRAAWAGLVSAVDADGRLGWVQASGVGPAAAQQNDSYPYGVGAFLLAGSEVAQL